MGYYVVLTKMSTGRPIGVTSATSSVPYRFTPVNVSFSQSANLEQDTATATLPLSVLPSAITDILFASYRDDTQDGLAYGWRYGLAIHEAESLAKLQTAALFYGAIVTVKLSPQDDTVTFTARDLAACLTRQLANRTQYVGGGAGILVNTNNNTDHTWTVTGSLFGLVAQLSAHNSWYPANYVEGRDVSGAHTKTINGLDLRSIADELQEVYKREYAPMVWYYGFSTDTNGYPRYEARMQVLYSATITTQPWIWQLTWMDVATVDGLSVNGDNTATNRWFTSNNTNNTTNNGTWVYYARQVDTSNDGGQLLFNQWDNVTVATTAQSHIAKRVPSAVVTFTATPEWEHNRPWSNPDTSGYRPVQLGDIIQIASFHIGTSQVFVTGMVTRIDHGEDGTKRYTLGKTVITNGGLDLSFPDEVAAMLNKTQDDARSLSGVLNSLRRDMARAVAPLRG